MIDLPHKIRIPQLPPELISRSHLIHVLQSALHRKLIALTAPAGYGKTSLLIDLAGTTTMPVCWYTLDSFDADPWIFLSYLAAAVEQRFPGALPQTTHYLSNHGQPLFQTVVSTLIREIGAIPSELVFFLDDWHLINDVAEISALVAQVVMRCPNSHVVLASRSHPSLPNQMLLSARRQFVSIDESQLRFSAAELATVLAADGVYDVSLEQAQQLVDQNDGWIAGILLMLQTTGGRVGATLDHKTTTSQSVHRFLAEQVLDQQPPALQQFLCETAMLSELTAERCNTLLGRSDSADLLDYLMAQRLFVSEIAPGVLRYHPLFRELLQKQLARTHPSRFHELGLKIATAYAHQGNWSTAFDLCTSIGDIPAARRVLHAGGEDLYLQGRLETLERAFATLPSDVLDVSLLCLKAKVALDRGKTDQARLLIEQATLHPGAAHSLQITLLQAVLDRVTGRYEQARDRVQQILQSSDDPILRGSALRTLGISQHRLGQTATAIETLLQARSIEQARGDMAALAQVEHELMVCYHTIGDLRSAAEVGQHAEACWSMLGNSGRGALTGNSLALNLALTGQYHEAYAAISAALRDAQDAAIPQYEAAILSTFGDIYADLSLWSRAAATYEAALRYSGTALIRAYLTVAQINLLVLQQQFAAARHTFDQLPQATIVQHTVACRLLQAQIAGGTGDIAAGLALAQQAIDHCIARGALLDQIRGWVVQAWLYSLDAAPDDAAILAALQRAASAAQPQGHVVAALAARILRPTLQRLRSRFAWSDPWLRQQDLTQQAAQELDQATPPLHLYHADPPYPPSNPSLILIPEQRDRDLPEQCERRSLLRAQYLGGDHVWIDDQAISLGPGRPREVLAYLLTHPQGTSRTELYQAIWYTDELAEGSTALSRVIYRLRAALPEGAIVTINRDTYSLDRSVLRVELDVEAFEQTLDSAAVERDPSRQLQDIWRVIQMYRGPFLRDVETPWCISMRLRLERRYRQALRLGAEKSEVTGNFQKALELFHQIVVLDAANLTAHAGIMRCHIALGEPAWAIAQYRKLTQILDEDLGITLDPESEPERIYRTILLD